MGLWDYLKEKADETYNTYIVPVAEKVKQVATEAKIEAAQTYNTYAAPIVESIGHE